VEPTRDPQFLDHLPRSGVCGVFVQLDMAPCRKPALGISMVHQKDLPRGGIDQDAVRREMLRRNR